jgi:hypothetical protein
MIWRAFSSDNSTPAHGPGPFVAAIGLPACALGVPTPEQRPGGWVRTSRACWWWMWTARCWTPTPTSKARLGPNKGGFGFYPLVAFLDRGDGTGEALAGILRPGNAGSNTATDHIEVVDLALAQLPKPARDQPLLVRADTGGATHALVDRLRQRGVGFSVSLPADERVRAAVLAVPADAWQPAIDADGQPRPGAEVTELHTLDLAGWPQGTRAICRREDPHPGAQPHAGPRAGRHRARHRHPPACPRRGGRGRDQ